MAFLVPVVAAAVGLGAFGTAVVQLAVGVGLSFLATKLTAKKAAGKSGGQQLSLKIEPDAERQVIFGKAATAGSLVYWQLSGSKNKRLQMVIALADHECDSLDTTIWVDSRAQTWNSSTGEVSGYSGRLKVFFRSGATGQTPPASLIDNSAGRWTSNDVGASVCYAIVEATYDPDVFPGGIPEIVFIVNGAKLYDARKDTTAGGSGAHRWNNPATWEWSDNPAVIAYNVLRGFRPGGQLLVGMHCPAEAVRYVDFAAAANACDESVSLAAGGTEKRYRCNMLAGTSASNADVLESVMGAMAGELIETGGIYRIQAGVTQPIVASLTDADVIVGQPFTLDTRRPRSELVNTVLATFADPARSYASVPLPVRSSPADVTEDGGIRLPISLDLSAVTSRTQAQRIMEVERRRARRQIRVSCTLAAKWIGLEPGDWVEFTSDRRGLVAQTFEIVATSVNEDLTVDVTLQQTDAAVDDWSSSDEIADSQVIALGPGGPPSTEISSPTLNAIIFASDVSGIERPGLVVTWTPPDDPTIANLVLQYRRIGDTEAIERTIFDPEAGAYRWADGVQGGTDYEARLKAVALPARPSVWTAWVSSATATAPQIVPVAQFANDIPQEIKDELGGLTEQERIELELVTARETIQGSVTSRLEEIRADLERVAATTIGNTALLKSQIEAVRNSANGSTVTITEIKQVTDELEGRWAVVADIDGRILGAVELATGLETSAFRVLANNFSVSHPTEGDLTPFVVIPGEGIFLDGVFVKDGSLTAEKISAIFLSAISANLGTVTAGRILSANGKLDINANGDTPYIRLTS